MRSNSRVAPACLDELAEPFSHYAFQSVDFSRATTRKRSRGGQGVSARSALLRCCLQDLPDSYGPRRHREHQLRIQPSIVEDLRYSLRCELKHMLIRFSTAPPHAKPSSVTRCEIWDFK